MSLSKGKGWGLPSIAFGFCVVITALFETFRGIPFALISAIGTYTVWISVSTVIYSNENTFIKRLIPGVIVWLLGAALIRVGGMDTLVFFGIPLNLYLVSSILGATFHPPESPSNPFGSSEKK